MKKREIIASLVFITILFNLTLVLASCPAGQIANFDGSCIGDPNYNAGAVSCASLMASSGKSAEALCKENAAGQCCSQEESTTWTYTPEDCSGDQIIPGSCEIMNQYMEITYQIGKELEKRDYNEEDYAIQQAMYDDIQNNWNTVYQPAEDQNSINFNQCLANYRSPDYTGPDCYDDIWKPQYDREIIAHYTYELQRAQQAYDELIGRAPKTTTSNTGSSGSQNTNTGSFNTNDNRGRDTLGAMNPSIDGYLGDAYVMRADGTKVIPGHELYLNVKDSVVTGQNANVNIIFSNAGSMNLGPNTEVRVGNALLDQFYLAKGTFKSKIKLQPLQKFEIKTPNANIFVRGTEYVVDYNQTTNTTTIYLNEGVLEINTQKGIMNLTAGNYLIIYPNGTTQTGSMNSENWNAMGNNFYEFSNFGKIFSYILGFILIFEIIIMFIVAIFVNKEIKNITKKDTSTGKGIASFVLGIFGLIFFMLPYIGLVLSMLSVLFARIQRANKPTKLAMAGLILGIISLILNLVMSWVYIMYTLFA